MYRTHFQYDYTKHSQGETFVEPSLVDSSGYESLESILGKCLRGDLSKLDNSGQNFDGYDNKVPAEKIAETISPQEGYDFDIVDKFDVDLRAQKAVESLKKKNFQKSAVADDENSKERGKDEDSEPTPSDSEKEEKNL